MKSHLALLILLTLAAGLLAGCGQTVGGGSAAAPAPVGDKAPDFTIRAYQGAGALGGQEARFSGVAGKGKPVVLNFWAGLCPPCRAEMPDFEKVHQRFKDRVLVVGVDIGPYIGLGSSQDGQALLKQLRVTYPAGLAADRSAVEAYGVLGMPTTVFIRADGSVHKTHTGILNEAQIVNIIEELLRA